MKKIPAWVWFALLRIATFVIPLVIMLLLGVPGWIAAIAAAIIGLCLSYIFLSKSRATMSAAIEKSRANKPRPVNVDEGVEDAAVDTAASAPARPSTRRVATASTTSVKMTSRGATRTPAPQKK